MDPIEQDYRVLRLLHQQPKITQRELAQILGISLGKANYALNALIERGLVKITNFKKSNHKMSYAYLLTPHGIHQKIEITKAFLQKKYGEYDRIKKEIKSLEQEIG